MYCVSQSRKVLNVAAVEALGIGTTCDTLVTRKGGKEGEEEEYGEEKDNRRKQYSNILLGDYFDIITHRKSKRKTRKKTKIKKMKMRSKITCYFRLQYQHSDDEKKRR